jgi:hypothetical protein
MKLLVNEVDGKKSGVMVPIPQYPLYSATLAEFDMHQVCVCMVATFYPMMFGIWGKQSLLLPSTKDVATHMLVMLLLAMKTRLLVKY